MRSARPAAACVLVLLGCDGGPSDPEPQLYPEIAGTYQVRAPVVKGTTPRADEGTLTITDDSRETPGFTGSYFVYVRDANGEIAQSGGEIRNATVDAKGTLQFDFGGAEFRHTGNLSGRTITTEWVLVAPSGAGWRGTMTAERP